MAPSGRIDDFTRSLQSNKDGRDLDRLTVTTDSGIKVAPTKSLRALLRAEHGRQADGPSHVISVVAAKSSRSLLARDSLGDDC